MKSSSESGCVLSLETAECPEPLCPWRALPAHGATSRVASEDITPPSSLIRAHASDQVPPGASVVPRTPGPCRLSPVPAGGWPFPTLSLQSLRRRLDPYPAASLECTCPFLPREHRPHATEDAFGTRNCPCNATSTGSRISGLQSFVYLQAPTLARPPDCIHRSIFVLGGRAVYTTHRPGGYPFRDVASLRVRLGQLTRLDLHQLDCSLVGCSRPRAAVDGRTGDAPTRGGGRLAGASATLPRCTPRGEQFGGDGGLPSGSRRSTTLRSWGKPRTASRPSRRSSS